MPYNLAAQELTKENLLEQIKIEIQKGEFKLDKKVNYYNFNSRNLNALLYDNYKNFGKVCEKLVKDGNVNKFYSSDFSAAKNNLRSVELIDARLNVSRSIIPFNEWRTVKGFSRCYQVQKNNYLSSFFNYKNIFITKI